MLERIGLPDGVFKAWVALAPTLAIKASLSRIMKRRSRLCSTWLRGRKLDLRVAGDRVVHGGMRYDQTCRSRACHLQRELAHEGILRYGFHGLSYEYIAGEATRDRLSADTSMGFTPTGGIAMGTRSGDLDPTVVLYLIREKKVPPALPARCGGQRPAALPSFARPIPRSLSA